MATFRILNQAPQYLLPNGQVNAGGSLAFYETDLTTLKNTWSDPDKSTLNANPVELDAAGRTETDVWGDGEYGVVLKDADGAVIWTRNNVEATGGAGTTIPALEAGKFLTNNGTILQWQDITSNLLPDQSGSNSYILSTDGANPIWIPQPEVEEPDIEIGSNGTFIGTGEGERFAAQSGTFTVPATSSRSSNVAIVFPVAFTKIQCVLPMASTYAVNSYGAGATITVAGYTPGSPASGATITANITDDGGDSGDEILNPVNGAWIAFGLVAAS